MPGLKLAFSRKYSILLSVVLVICTLKVNASETPNNKLKVKIYYEALCSDSISFIKNQLQPSMSQKGRLNYTDLKFVPYGHVVFYTDPNTNQRVLQCQHGKRECELNAEHACIIENNTYRESYDMITCLMRGYNTKLDKCATHYGINLDAAKNCKATRTVVDILEKYGVDTYALNPSFVPTITIDGIFDWYEQTEILYNFDRIFCRKYKSKFNITLTGC